MTALPDTLAAPAVSKRDLFVCFLQMGLVSFGGVLPWARRMLVEQRRWLSNEEFVHMLSLGQMLPGPNVVNVSIMVGNRFHGGIGALLAITGLLLAPLLIILVLALLYTEYGHLPAVQRAFAGTAAATAGLVLAMGIKMLVLQPRTWPVGVVTVATFAGAGLLGLPLLAVLAVLAPLGILLAWKFSA
jgi:chromate transporter